MTVKEKEGELSLWWCILKKKSSLSDCFFDGPLNQGKTVSTMGISALVLDLFYMKLYDSGFKLFSKWLKINGVNFF